MSICGLLCIVLHSLFSPNVYLQSIFHCMHVCTCACVHVCVHMHVHMPMPMCRCACASMPVKVHVHVHMWTWRCMCTCACAFVFVKQKYFAIKHCFNKDKTNTPLTFLNWYISLNRINNITDWSISFTNIVFLISSISTGSVLLVITGGGGRPGIDPSD